MRLKLWPLALSLVIVGVLVNQLWPLWLETRWFIILEMAGGLLTVGLAEVER